MVFEDEVKPCVCLDLTRQARMDLKKQPQGKATGYAHILGPPVGPFYLFRGRVPLPKKNYRKNIGYPYSILSTGPSIASRPELDVFSIRFWWESGIPQVNSRGVSHGTQTTFGV